MDFNGSGLLQTLKTTRSNADTISEKGGVTKILGLDSTFAVISLTNAAQPHIVNNDSGRIRCDCDGFKWQKICSHGLAVACTEDILQDTVSKWVPNYSSLIQDSIPKRSGQKPGPKRIRPSRMAEQRDVTGMEECCKGVDPFSKPEPFYLKWLSRIRVTTCYGCGNKIWAGIEDPVLPGPCDVVITREQICAYTPQGSVGLCFSVKPEELLHCIKVFRCCQ